MGVPWRLTKVGKWELRFKDEWSGRVRVVEGLCCSGCVGERKRKGGKGEEKKKKAKRRKRRKKTSYLSSPRDIFVTVDHIEDTSNDR